MSQLVKLRLWILTELTVRKTDLTRIPTARTIFALAENVMEVMEVVLALVGLVLDVLVVVLVVPVVETCHSETVDRLIAGRSLFRPCSLLSNSRRTKLSCVFVRLFTAVNNRGSDAGNSTALRRL